MMKPRRTLLAACAILCGACSDHATPLAPHTARSSRPPAHVPPQVLPDPACGGVSGDLIKLKRGRPLTLPTGGSLTLVGSGEDLFEDGSTAFHVVIEAVDPSGLKDSWMPDARDTLHFHKVGGHCLRLDDASDTLASIELAGLPPP